MYKCELPKEYTARELATLSSGYKHAFEVIDTHKGDPENECSLIGCDACCECILLTDNKEEAETFIKKNSFRYELIQNGENMSAKTTIESSIFTWGQCEEMCAECLGFSDVVLVAPVGAFPAGTRFASAWIDWENSILSLFEEGNDVPHKFPLKLTVG